VTQYLLLQSVVVPLVAAAACYLAAPRLGKSVGWIAFAALFASTFVLVAGGWSQLYSGGSPIQELYTWAPTAGLSFGFLADGLSFPVALLINLVLAASAVYSMRYMEGRIRSLYGGEKSARFGVYYLCFLLVSTGLIGIVLSTNLIELYLFLELVLIPTFVLISLFGYVQKERVGIIYIIWNQLGAFVFLGGIALAYTASCSAASGCSFDISALAGVQASTYAYWIAGLILVGWLLKMGIFGLHMWLPITEAEPPTSFAPTMAVVSGIGAYVIARLLFFDMPTVFRTFSLPLMAWAVITMFYGGAIASFLGAAGGVFYFGSHILGKFVMFAVAGILVTQTGLRDSKQMGGLAGKMPFTAALFVLGALILSAVPPTSGFQAEWIMFAGIFAQGTQGSAYMLVALLGIIATLLTVAYTFWPIKRIFFGQLRTGLDGAKDPPLTMTIPLLAVVVVSIMIGIYPDLVTKFLAQLLPAVGGIVP